MHDLETALNVLRKQHHIASNGTQQQSGKKDKRRDSLFDEQEARKVIDLQKQEIRRMRGQIKDLETDLAARPPSGKLPPMSQISI